MSVIRKTKPGPKLRQRLNDMSVFPFPCANCSHPIEEGKLYCSQLCVQIAELVRYVRRCRVDGRYQEPDVQEAIRIQFALILGEGYDKEARRLSKAIRKAVIERDKGRCQKCGQPARVIDHIKGNSSEMSNLQLLCDSCHNEKTRESFVKITPESHPKTWKKAQALKRRMRSSKPLQLCDSEVWVNTWRTLLRERRHIIKERETFSLG